MCERGVGSAWWNGEWNKREGERDESGNYQRKRKITGWVCGRIGVTKGSICFRDWRRDLEKIRHVRQKRRLRKLGFNQMLNSGGRESVSPIGDRKLIDT